MICWRKSGPQSISSRVFSVSNNTEQRSLLSCGSVLLQVWQLQPMVGTPHDVPVPKKMSLYMNHLSSNNIHFRIDVYAELLLDVMLYLLAECHDFLTSSTTQIHQYQSLLVMNSSTT